MDQVTPISGRHSVITSNISQRLSSALKARFSKLTSPYAARTLRDFSATEVAQFLGLQPEYLKELHNNGTLPLPSTLHGHYHYYSAQEIWAMREILETATQQAGRYVPHRKSNEYLQIWQVMNLKGGTSKSTTTLHLAHYFALHGYRVLLIDLDPQGSVTALCGYATPTEFDGLTIYDAIRYKAPVAMTEAVVPTHFPGLSLVPSSIALSEFDIEAAVFSNPEQPFYERVKDAVKQVEKDFDLVFIDSPPQIGFLTIAGMAASTSLLVPFTPSMLDIASTAQFLDLAGSYFSVIEEAGANLECDNFKFLVTRDEPNNPSARRLTSFMRNLFPDRVLTATALKSNAINNAMLSKQSIYEVPRSVNSRHAYDRGRKSMDAIGQEVEQMIKAVWAREV